MKRYFLILLAGSLAIVSVLFAFGYRPVGKAPAQEPAAVSQDNAKRLETGPQVIELKKK